MGEETWKNSTPGLRFRGDSNLLERGQLQPQTDGVKFKEGGHVKAGRYGKLPAEVPLNSLGALSDVSNHVCVGSASHLLCHKGKKERLF